MNEQISAERGAQNQALFRSVNEKVEEINSVFDELVHDSIEWVCECADTDCDTRVEATLTEYESVRGKPTTFIVSPGHIYPEIERIVEQTERYDVVEKIGRAAEIAAEFNERRDCN